jgi:predicted ATPase/DNA-binding XRE family transcriptional regulator
MARDASEFGRNVRALRLGAGLTQAELAERSGISERTVSDLERGLRATVYPDTARRLAAALAVEPHVLPAFLRAARGVRAVGMAPQDGTSPPIDRSFIPFRLTRLIGRERELEEVLGLLEHPHARLVTVVGPGGVGKTRLAAEVGALSAARNPRDTYFVNLSDVEDAALVLPTIAACVGLQPGPSGLVPRLARRLGEGRALLVLDTVEHLLDAAPQIGELLVACPRLTVLATGRTAMHIRGEREVPLQTLAVESSGSSEGEIAPAVALFVERATAVSPSFALTSATLPIAAEICARLDGLPLAIELAAARIKHMPLADLHANLDHRLDRLVGGPRDAPRRHQTMRAALDWSYALLDGPGLRLFRSLSAFRGTFGRETALAISGDALDDSEDVVTSLSALVNASLVQLERGQSGHGRYRLLDLVRDYAQERAEAAGDFDTLRRRHLRHFLEIAERAEAGLRGADQQEWYASLHDDEANFRAALTFALDVGEAELALRLAGALWMFWRWAGLFREGRGWLDAALATAEGCSSAVRLRALWGAGWLAYHQGDYRGTDDTGRAMLQLLGDVDDRLSRRNALTLIGNAALAELRFADAIASLEDALTTCDDGEVSWYLGTSLLNLGTAHLAAGRPKEAERLLSRAVTVYSELGDRHFTARTLFELGYTAIARGHSLEAAAFMREAMEMAAELGDGWSIAEGLEAVACLCSDTDPATTAVLAGAAERLRDRIAMRAHPPDAAINREHVERARSTLGTVAFEEASATGRGTPPAAIVEVALTAAAAVRATTPPRHS